jgi:AraC family transcriptional regulator of adaptative response/methylated-DNA-[protein]-cysteine methyltransferase
VRTPDPSDASSQSRKPEAWPKSGGYDPLMNAKRKLELVGRPPSEAEWAAIAGRTSLRGDPWLLVVTSTGIVCRPGCPARTPARERVRIVGGLEEALDAGARPCLRCRPDRLDGDKAARAVGHRAARAAADRAAADRAAGAAEDGELAAAALARLAASLDAGEEPPTDRELAGSLATSERRLRETFRDSVGVTPRAWIAARRAERLRARLADGGDVLGAVFDAGYGSASAGYEAAAAELGMAPARYRSGGAGERIRWTVAAIPDGVALVAATDRGLCAVRLGGIGDEGALEAALRAEYPRAAVRRDDRGMGELAALVGDLAAGQPRPEASTLPLDVHATAFRRRVWEALRSIPAGQTRSYGQVAAAVGAPRAARAVGAACAANPLAVVVPCHRVVASDGSLHGYAYGLARKRQLLDAEHAALGRPAAASRAFESRGDARPRRIASSRPGSAAG